MLKKKKTVEFPTEYTVKNSIKNGDKYTKLSMIIMGVGNFARKEFVKGFIFLGSQIAFVAYMLLFGLYSLSMLPTLGTEVTGEKFDEVKGIYVQSFGHNSMLLLLYGIVTIGIICAFILLWRTNMKSAYRTQRLKEAGEKISSFKEEIARYFDKELHKTLLFLPVFSIIVFTVLPLIFMISMAFTNFDRDHQPPGNLFTWTGLENFKELLSFSGELGSTFWNVAGWTIIWAIFATFLNYILGILLALLINRKGTKAKPMWRLGFVMSIAVPQFVTLLVINVLLQDQGALNVLLRQLGLLAPGTYLPFLSNADWARVTVIVVNLWVGIPYTLLTVTGILQNIPRDLYEAAAIDGAGPFKTFTKITMPQVLFITAPSLLLQFIGNINNFNVIYLLTGGGPASLDYYKATAGKTDLLVTWLYKLTIQYKDYNIGATIGILVFVISTVSALLIYRRTGAYKNEEGFQ